MPTGYTGDVQNGKITEFKDFAMRCARAMGVCVMMRDDPADTPIPERWEPSDYHAKRKQESESELTAVLSMTGDQVQEVIDKEYASDLESYHKSCDRNNTGKQNYLAMIEKVQQWNPPTEEHNGLKEFMLNQLHESIRFDYGYEETRPEKKTLTEWMSQRVGQLRRDIKYHDENYKQEIERTESRNKWMADLRSSVTANT